MKTSDDRNHCCSGVEAYLDEANYEPNVWYGRAAWLWSFTRAVVRGI